MTIEIDVARTDLTELLALVEAGHDVILLRDAVPLAKATRILPEAEVQAAIEAIIRSREGRAPTTIDEILAWKHEGRP